MTESRWYGRGAAHSREPSACCKKTASQPCSSKSLPEQSKAPEEENKEEEIPSAKKGEDPKKGTKKRKSKADRTKKAKGAKKDRDGHDQDKGPNATKKMIQRIRIKKSRELLLSKK